MPLYSLSPSLLSHLFYFNSSIPFIQQHPVTPCHPLPLHPYSLSPLFSITSASLFPSLFPIPPFVPITSIPLSHNTLPFHTPSLPPLYTPSSLPFIHIPLPFVPCHLPLPFISHHCFFIPHHPGFLFTITPFVLITFTPLSHIMPSPLSHIPFPFIPHHLCPFIPITPSLLSIYSTLTFPFSLFNHNSFPVFHFTRFYCPSPSSSLSHTTHLFIPCHPPFPFILHHHLFILYHSCFLSPITFLFPITSIPLSHVTLPLHTSSPLLYSPSRLPSCPYYLHPFIPHHLSPLFITPPLYSMSSHPVSPHYPSPLFHISPFALFHSSPSHYSMSPLSFIPLPTSLSFSAPIRASQLTNTIFKLKKRHTQSKP